jgi:hypothetical protein
VDIVGPTNSEHDPAEDIMCPSATPLS